MGNDLDLEIDSLPAVRLTPVEGKAHRVPRAQIAGWQVRNVDAQPRVTSLGILYGSPLIL
jgi:hypothetical protein